MLNALREEERRAVDLRARIDESRQKVVIPHPKVIVTFLEEALRSLGTDDVIEARQLLHQLSPRPFVLTPDAEGYRLSGFLDLNTHVRSGSGDVLDKYGCGGVHHDLSRPALRYPLQAVISR